MIDPPPERVTWYYGEWRTAYENLDILNMRLEEGLWWPKPTVAWRTCSRRRATTPTRPSSTSYRICFRKTRRTAPSVWMRSTWSCSKTRETRLSSQTWPDRCTPVEARSSRRRSPMRQPRLTAIFWSTSNRTRPTTCVYARPYCRMMYTSGSTYRSCLCCAERCESTINGSCVLIIRRVAKSCLVEWRNDSTTSAKIARYAERKQLAYKLTDEGVLLLDGRGKKIHLRNCVVTLRNALGLHALPERVTTNEGQWCRAIDPVGDNRVLNKQQQQQQHTNVVTPPTTTTMLHVRKMALVDPRLLKSLRENPTPLSPLPDPTSNAIDTTLRDLDAEMTSIGLLDRSDADESEKVRLYNQALLRYNDMTKPRAAKPIPVVVAVKKEAAATMTTMPTTALVVEPTDIVGTLPKTLQMKGRQLLSRLSAVTWNERGELIHKGVAIRGSNAVDLIHDLLRNRKTPDPVGWQQFANQMRAANIPMELVGNVTRRLYLQKKRGKRTPQKRKPTTPETPMSEWESL